MIEYYELPQFLSYEIGEDVDMKRIRMAMHRTGIKRQNEIGRHDYNRLRKYFEDRRPVPLCQVKSVVEYLGDKTVERLLGKGKQWTDALRRGQVVMNVREQRILEKHMKSISDLRR